MKKSFIFMGKVLEAMTSKKKNKRTPPNNNEESSTARTLTLKCTSIGEGATAGECTARVQEILEIASEEFLLHEKVAECDNPAETKEICDAFMAYVTEKLNADSKQSGQDYDLQAVQQCMQDEFDSLVDDIDSLSATSDCIHVNLKVPQKQRSDRTHLVTNANETEKRTQHANSKSQDASAMSIETLGKLVTAKKKGQYGDLLPLHVTAALGDVEKVRQYFERDQDTGRFQFDPNGRCMNDGSTPLHLAIRSKNLDVVRALLESGADSTTTDYIGDNSLMVAVKTGDANIINTVWPHRRNLNINHSNVLGQTALHLTTERKWECCLHFLLQNKADPNCQTTTGMTPLMIAANKGDKKTIEELLKAGADILMEDHEGYTCICKAFQAGKKDLMKYLLAQIPQERRDVFIKNRMDLVLDPPIAADEEKHPLEDVYFPVLYECTNIAGFRNAFYSQRIVNKLVIKLEANSQNVEITRMTSVLIFATMLKFSEELDTHFVKQYMNSKGPDMTIHIVKYYTEVYKMSEKSSFAAFLPMIGLCELDEGRVWLKKNYLSVSEYINFLNKDCLKFYLTPPRRECQWCLETKHFKKITVVWHHFHDVMNAIQTEQRERNMMELLMEEDREKERQEKKKERKRQKRQEKLKKEVESNIEVKHVEIRQTPIFHQMTPVTNAACTNDNANVGTESNDTQSKGRRKLRPTSLALQHATEPYLEDKQGIEARLRDIHISDDTLELEAKEILEMEGQTTKWTTVQTKKHLTKEKERVQACSKKSETPLKKKTTPKKNSKKNVFKPIEESIVKNTVTNPSLTGKTRWADVAKGLPTSKSDNSSKQDTGKQQTKTNNVDFAEKDFPTLEESPEQSSKITNRPLTYTFHFDAPCNPTKDQSTTNETKQTAQCETLVRDLPESPVTRTDTHREQTQKYQHDLQKNGDQTPEKKPEIRPLQHCQKSEHTDVQSSVSINHSNETIAIENQHQPSDVEHLEDGPHSAMEDECILQTTGTSVKELKVNMVKMGEHQNNTVSFFFDVVNCERNNDPFFDPTLPPLYTPTDVSDSSVEALFECTGEIPSWFTDADSFVDESQWAENDPADERHSIPDTNSEEIVNEDLAIVDCRSGNANTFQKYTQRLPTSRFLGTCISNNDMSHRSEQDASSGPPILNDIVGFDGKRTAVIKPLVPGSQQRINSSMTPVLDLNIKPPKILQEESVLYPSDLNGESICNEGHGDSPENDFFPSFHAETKLSSDYDPTAISTFHKMQLLQLQQLNNYYIQQRNQIMSDGSQQQSNFLYYASCVGMKRDQVEDYLAGKVPGTPPKYVNNQMSNCNNDTEFQRKCFATNETPHVNDKRKHASAISKPETPGSTVPGRLPPTPGGPMPRFNPADIKSIQAAQAAMAGQLMTQLSGIIRMQMESKMKSVRWRQQLWAMRNLPKEKRLQLGKIVIPRDTDDRVYIANPSSGAVMLGFLTDGSEVAVKVLTGSQRSFKKEELQHLTSLDVSKYFMIDYKAFSFHGGIYYLAMELHEYTLEEFLMKEGEPVQHVDKVLVSHKLVWQLLRGLASLHQHCLIVHGEIRPDQLVIDLNGNLKITDYGLSKNTTRDGPQVQYTDEEKCWLAPEVLLYNQKVSFKSEIWVAGMLVYYILSGGRNPFGEEACDIIYNIGKQIYVMDYISEEAGHLLSVMLSPNKTERPCISDTLKHPFFWADEKRLRFILIAGSDVLRDLKAGIPMDGSVTNSMINIIGSMPCHIKIINWIPEVESGIFRDMKSFRQYKNNVVELVLFVYNCCQHFDKMSNTSREIIDEPCTYFLTKFPTLFMTVYRAIQMSSRTEKTCYKPFF